MYIEYPDESRLLPVYEQDYQKMNLSVKFTSHRSLSFSHIKILPTEIRN